MQTSSPSWNTEDNAGTGADSAVASDTLYTDRQQPFGNGSTVAAGLDQRADASTLREVEADSSFGMAGSGGKSVDGNSDGKNRDDDGVEMVAFNKGTSRTDLTDASVVRKNGGS